MRYSCHIIVLSIGTNVHLLHEPVANKHEIIAREQQKDRLNWPVAETS